MENEWQKAKLFINGEEVGNIESIKFPKYEPKPIKYMVSQTFYDMWDKLYGDAEQRFFVFKELPDYTVIR